ncbi:MAG: phytoene/squalene synthase family protein [Planctomycetota bacterium]
MSQDAYRVLEQTSRTFFLPIVRLPEGLKEAVASAYLCMRAIDEIEDHRELNREVASHLLDSIALIFQASDESLPAQELERLFAPHAAELPEVTLRLAEWADFAPSSIALRIWDSTAAMAARMAHWVRVGFRVETEADLDRYTYGVAGAVGLLLSDLWAWHDGTQTDRTRALGFGRGLQAVNILRNHQEDLAAGADFFPDGWTPARMQEYARKNLSVADEYTALLPEGPIRAFCAIPLALAHATLDALIAGRDKLTRAEVLKVVELAVGPNIHTR